MKISYNWLKQYLHINLPAEEVADLLTNCGLEVEGIEAFQSLKGGLEGLVIGEVKTCAKHPNADKLSLTTVDIGKENLLSIVCGAPNVAAGQKVIVATVGSKLYPIEGEPFEIKKSKIRGELSEGMICAEDEIGLGKSHEGIIVLPTDAKVGMSAKDFFKVEEDKIFEIGLTPNRADAASHIGVARDLNAILISENKSENTGVIYPSLKDFKIDNNSFPIEVEVPDTNACPRYSGITVSGVAVKESPPWLKNKLLSIGVHPINNIVDITNYVLHECGQPLHAFDADEITGKKVIVRKAKAGEKFITLDSVERKLSADDLMICNTGKAMCIAGVFGGIESGISETTKNVFIESAYFNPSSIRKTSKHHGLKTDASFRFERGTDPEITLYALKHAAMMMKEIAGGNISSEIVDVYPKKIEHKKIEYHFESAERLIGEQIEKSKLKQILYASGIEIEKEENDFMRLSVPSYKVDVEREADVVEEVLRIHGYNKIELPSKMSASLSYFPKADNERIQNVASDFLSSNGFYEILTNSFTKENEETADAIKIQNPLSKDLGVLRQSLLQSGLEAIQYNRNRKNADLKLYEFGATYHKNNNRFDERRHLALFMTGKKFEASWNGDRSEVNFFFLKSFVNNLLLRVGIETEKLSESDSEDASFSEAITLKENQNVICTFGAVVKKHLKEFDINTAVYFADFNWQNVLKLAGKKTIEYKEVSKFPQVRRDLSMVLNSDVSYAQIRSLAFKTEKQLLKEMHLFDVYEGDKIETGKKSYAMTFILLDEHQTLTDKQIDKAMNRLMEVFQREGGAIIRKG
jgi:phenylalanyl-tRNA synthetase beta chain